MSKVFLIGVNVIYCKQGSYKLSFPDHDPVILLADEVFVAYPGHYVTFEALDRKHPNTFNYTILSGSFADEFVSGLGFYDFFQCSCAYPTATLDLLHSILTTKDTSESSAKTEIMCLFHSMMMSVIEQAKLQGDAFFYDAIQLINQNVAKGQVRIEPVCEALGISRSQLHRIFIRYGFTTVGAYIKDVQFRFAMKLLRVSRLSVSEIAYRCGFASSTNFTAFIRKRTGLAPIKHRGKHMKPVHHTPAV